MNVTIVDHTGNMTLMLLDDLVKVFCDERPRPSLEEVDLSVLRGDRLSFQLAFSGNGGFTGPEHWHTRFAKVKVTSPLSDYITVRLVESVPCQYVTHADADDNYLRKAPGLYPDLLLPINDNFVTVTDGLWRALWVDLELPTDVAPGDYPASFEWLDPQTGELMASAALTLTVLPAALPELDFPRTEWFHADCLADWYGVEVFSEAHWEILRKFIRAAVRRGINMILTPQFTPPLDTGVGYERTTTQLVEIWREDGGWRFDFANMRRWISLCLDCGVKYFEMSHLFSQWGAVAAPKVMGWADGEYRQLFGWDTPAAEGEYPRFLHSYLPQLCEVLRAFGIEDRTFFHISDEPSLKQLESYRAARETVREDLAGCRFLEAVSDYDFFSHGLIDSPVCATSRIGTYLEHHTPGLWSYYCTVQYKRMSNCFIGMPSGRTRIYGAQLYKFDIAGSLRWGYNFYNSAYSYYRVNPYLSNDCGASVPAGDPFIVYPGPDGEPLESLRMLLLDDAIRDLRALRALEAKLGRDATLALMEEELEQPLTFDTFPDWPEDARYLLRMRQRVNKALCADTP